VGRRAGRKGDPVGRGGAEGAARRRRAAPKAQRKKRPAKRVFFFWLSFFVFLFQCIMLVGSDWLNLNSVLLFLDKERNIFSASLAVDVQKRTDRPRAIYLPIK